MVVVVVVVVDLLHPNHRCFLVLVLLSPPRFVCVRPPSGFVLVVACFVALFVVVAIVVVSNLLR